MSQNSKENTCAGVFLNKYTFCKIFKNIYFIEQPQTAASVQNTTNNKQNLPVEEISVVSNIYIGFDLDHVIKPTT